MILMKIFNRWKVENNSRLLSFHSQNFRQWKRDFYNRSELICNYVRSKQMPSSDLRMYFRQTGINYNTSGKKFISQFSCSFQKLNENPNAEKEVKVYTGNVTTMVKSVKFFSLSTSIIGILMQPFVIPTLLEKSLGLTIFTEFIVLGYSIITPLILHMITKRYIVYMYFNHDTKCFTLATLSLFFRERKFNFTAENVEIPDIPGPFTTFTVHGVPFLLDPRNFADYSVYEHLMGYDKPLNLHLNVEPKNEKIN